jgi:hypothetical protein
MSNGYRGVILVGDITDTVRRGSPDPAASADRRSPEVGETCGQGLWLGRPLFAAVPETGHNRIGGHRPTYFSMSLKFFLTLFTLGTITDWQYSISG